MSKKTVALYCQLCVATILCALALATTVKAQTRRGHARASSTQDARARKTSTPASTQPAVPTPSSSSVPSSAPSSVPDAAPSPSVPEEDADLVIIANVTAKELRFDAVPNPSVTFPGKPERATEWSAERTNLPPQVQPGVTYRDIGIRLKIVSRFADIERIVAEALGEVPTTDDAPQPVAAPPVAAVTTNETASSLSSLAGAPRALVTPGAAPRKARAHRARRSG